MIKFLPDLLSLMVDNTLRPILRQLKETDHTPHAMPPPAHFTQFLSRHSGAMHLACGYTLDLLDKRDIKSLTLLLPSLAKAFVKSETVGLPDTFLHLLVLGLSAHGESLKESTMLLLLRDFWVPCCQSSEQVLLHLLRMLWSLHARVSEALLREVLETVEPGKEVCGVTIGCRVWWGVSFSEAQRSVWGHKYRV